MLLFVGASCFGGCSSGVRRFSFFSHTFLCCFLFLLFALLFFFWSNVQMEFLEALVHIASRLHEGHTLAENIDEITKKFLEALNEGAQDIAYTRAKSLMDRVDFGLNT